MLDILPESWTNGTNTKLARAVGLYDSNGPFTGAPYIQVGNHQPNTLGGLNDNAFRHDKGFKNVRAFIIEHYERIFRPSVAKHLKREGNKLILA